jgi:predicted nucleic acid-binding protein
VAEIVFADTGPLVALLDADEEYHAGARDRMREIMPPLFICDAAMTECCFLLRKFPRGLRQVRDWCESGLLQHIALDSSAFLRALELMERYANVPMSFADACLVSLVESRPGSRVLTLDRDFLIYRSERDQVLPLLAPFAE